MYMEHVKIAMEVRVERLQRLDSRILLIFPSRM